jgi:hypothetical protein
MNPAGIRWNIMPIIVAGIGLIIALFLGVFIGGSETFQLGLIFGLAVLFILLANMRQHIWLLLPMFWGFTGMVSALPLPFSVRDLVVMLVAVVGSALLALRVFRFRNSLHLLDVILLLNLAQVCIVFLSHPVGLRALSSEQVGARPYFNIAIATIAYLTVSNQIISPKLGRLLPVVMLIPEAFLSAISLMIRAIPSLGHTLVWFYSDFAPTLQPNNAVMERVTGTVKFGTGLITALCSYFPPFSLLNPVRPMRVLLFLAGITMVLISGFRSQLLTVAAIFLISSYLRKGTTHVLTVFAGMFLAVVVLIVINSAVHPLPLSMQRTLSFLPGNWDSRAVADATGSTEWRLEMWKDIPKSSQYVHNKLMGDGFGFNRAELQAIERQAYASGGGMEQEDFMLIGAFHNGPLSAIRFVGAVGLLLYYALLIYSAVYGWCLIRASKGSDFYPLALFISLVVIWEPLNYTFVFGAYDSALPNTIFAVAMLKLIHNSLRQAKSAERHWLKSASVLPQVERVGAGAT